MIIYIEVILLVDFIINLLTILIIKTITFIKLKKLLIFVFVIDLIYTILYLYKIDLYIIKYILPFIYMFLSFKCDFINLIKITFLYFVFNYLLGGIILSINIASNIVYLITIIVYASIFIISLLLFKRKELNLKYKIEFYYMDKKYTLDAFLDTGCSIFYKGYPVIVLNRKFEFKNYTDDYVLISTATTNKYEKVYYINELKLQGKTIKCYCVFLDIPYMAVISSDILYP